MDLIPENEKFVLTLDEEELRDYFKVHLACPLSIKPGSRYISIAEELLRLWTTICRKYEIDVETKYIFDDDEERDFELSEDSYDELKPIAISLSYWKDKAKAEFLEMVKPIKSTMADVNIYRKHLPYKKMDRATLKKLAIRQKAGYFYDNVDVDYLDEIFVKSFKPFFKVIIQNENIRYGIKCLEKIGVTDEGIDTEYILIEINKSSGISHAYPCSEEKATSCSIKNEGEDFKLFFDLKDNIEN